MRLWRKYNAFSINLLYDERKRVMKLNNDRIIEIYIKTSYLYWCGLLFAGTLIMLVAIDVIDVTTIALDMGMFVFFALDIVSAACASTKNRFSNKNIKINIIATSIRIAFFVPLVIIGITKNTILSAFGILVFPIIDALYLIIIIKIKKMILSEDEITKYQRIYSRDRSRYSLVKKHSNTFASWVNYFGEKCYLYVMPSDEYNGVFIIELSNNKEKSTFSISKNYINVYDFELFIKEFEDFIYRFDKRFKLNTQSIAKEIWNYLKQEAEMVKGEVSPEYQETFYKDLVIDGSHVGGGHETVLYDLSVGHILDKSAVFWDVSWFRGGKSEMLIIDDETAKNLTVESLIEWMKNNMGDFFDLCTTSKYLENDELRTWCKMQSEKAKSNK